MRISTVFRTTPLICVIILLSSVQAFEVDQMDWEHRVGLSGSTMAAIVGDACGQTYVTGHAYSGFKDGASSLGGTDAYLLKIDARGERVWVRQLGTSGMDTGSCLATDEQGNCYVAGDTLGQLAPQMTGPGRGGSQDVFVAKFSCLGESLWIRQLGSEQMDGVRDLRFHEDGYCYLVGQTRGCIDGIEDGQVAWNPFAAKVDPDGHLVWVSQLRDKTVGSADSVGVDPNGILSLVCRSGHVATFDANGKHLDLHRVFHSFSSFQDICADDLGHVYMCGWENDYVSAVVQFDRHGRKTWVRNFLENGWSCPKAIVLCPDGSQDVIAGGCQGGSAGGSCEAFYLRYDDQGELVSVYRSPQEICGQSVGAGGRGIGYAIGDDLFIKTKSTQSVATRAVLEAEEAQTQATIMEVTEPGYSGSGYVRVQEEDSWLEWETMIRQPGMSKLLLRFMNRLPASIPVILYVNEIALPNTVELPSTQGRDGWLLLGLNAELPTDCVTVKLSPQLTNPEGGLYLDSLEITHPVGNVATGKAVICSHETGANRPGAAVDGHLDTAWHIPRANQWIEIDLGYSYQLHQTILFSGGAGAYRYKIEARVTAEAPYQLLADRSDSNVNLGLDEPNKDTFPVTQARYLRLTVTKCPRKGMDLNEIQVFCIPHFDGEATMSPATP